MQRAWGSWQQKGGRDLTHAIAAHPLPPTARAPQRLWTPEALFGEKLLHLGETNHLSRDCEGTGREPPGQHPQKSLSQGAKLWPRDYKVQGPDSPQLLWTCCCETCPELLWLGSALPGSLPPLCGGQEGMWAEAVVGETEVSDPDIFGKASTEMIPHIPVRPT